MLEDTIKIIGRLIEVPDLSEKCGDTAVASVFKFDVVKVLEGDCPYQTILLTVPCPDQNDEGIFVANHLYTIQMSRTFSQASLYVVQDGYTSLKLPRFWCLEIVP
jgi:hypothetical protein